MPGATTRFGPAKENGLTRSDQTGSVRILTPATCTSNEAWPTMVTRMASPSMRRAGFAGGNGLTIRFGQAIRPPPSCQRSTSEKPSGAMPPGLKNRVPSK